MKRKYKTYKERADYLAEINKSRADIYYAVAQFFGEDEIPPIPPKIKNSFRKK